jgi:hypothetical protein
MVDFVRDRIYHGFVVNDKLALDNSKDYERLGKLLERYT